MKRAKRAIVFAGAAFLLVLAPFRHASAQDRADCGNFRSTVLHSVVRYCVLLPASFSQAAAAGRKYPVLYDLHGLGGTHQFMVFDGEWTELQNLRRDKRVGEFLVVTPEGWDTFYIDSRDKATPYSAFFLREFMPYIERKYRAIGTRSARGITGFSMGGYGALRMAFAHPELFGSVSAHSAVLFREPPTALNALGSSGSFVAEESFAKVFGNPIDRSFWDMNSPFSLARKNAVALGATKIYFDCGTEDAFGLYRGASDLDAALKALKVQHDFHLYPGAHNTRYLLDHVDATFAFHWREFAGAKGD